MVLDMGVAGPECGGRLGRVAIRQRGDWGDMATGSEGAGPGGGTALEGVGGPVMGHLWF